MTVEKYIKRRMAQKELLSGDVAQVLGYTRQSFLNKLSRKSINLRDVIMLASMFDKQLAIIDNIGKVSHLFDAEESLSPEDYKRVCDYIGGKDMSKSPNKEQETKVSFSHYSISQIVHKSLSKKELIDIIEKTFPEEYIGRICEVTSVVDDDKIVSQSITFGRTLNAY